LRKQAKDYRKEEVNEVNILQRAVRVGNPSFEALAANVVGPSGAFAEPRRKSVPYSLVVAWPIAVSLCPQRQAFLDVDLCSLGIADIGNHLFQLVSVWFGDLLGYRRASLGQILVNVFARVAEVGKRVVDAYLATVAADGRLNRGSLTPAFRKRFPRSRIVDLASPVLSATPSRLPDVAHAVTKLTSDTMLHLQVEKNQRKALP
jgi:hypothetical protein